MSRNDNSTTSTTSSHDFSAFGGAGWSFTDGASPAEPVAAPEPAATPVAEPAPVATFDSIASTVDVTEPAPEPAPVVEEGTPAAAPIPEPAAPAPTPEPAAAPTPEAEGEQPAPTTEEAVFTALEAMDREDVPDDLKPMYDQLTEMRKGMQAAHTRRSQALAEERRQLEAQPGTTEFQTAVQQQVQAQLAQFGVTQFQQQPQQQVQQPVVQSDPDAIFWSADLGEPVTLQQALEAEGPELMDRHIRQRTVIEGRKAAAEMANYLMPQIQGVQQNVEQQQAAAADAFLGNFITANPDLAQVEGGIDTAIGLVQAGMAQTLEEGAEKARNMLLGPQHVQQAVALGQHLGAESAKQVQDNKQKFSVPSGSTKPVVDGLPVKGQTFDAIGDAVIAGLNQ